MVDYSKKVSRKRDMLPPYLFARIDQLKKEAEEKGVEVIDLGVGDPDRPTPKHIMQVMDVSLRKHENHQYPSYVGKLSFREAVARWYKERFDVDLDPEREVLTLIGSKEGIGHIPFAFLDPGDVCLVPNPGYPVYRACTLLAGGEPHDMPLIRENGFLPDLEGIPGEFILRAKLMFLNYPNNPTSAVADMDFFTGAVRFARENGIALCHDAAYSEIYYSEDDRPRSIMEVEGAGDVAVEFHSLSKTYNMTGWRIGFVVGNADIISALGKIKSNIDSGAFGAVQDAAAAALNGNQACVAALREIYQRRRDIFYLGLKKAGIQLDIPKATFYVWIPVPQGHTSESFSTLLLEKAGLVTTPGVGFGSYGEGYVRVSLTVAEEVLREAAERLRDLSF